MRMPFCRVIRLLQWVDYAFLCRLFEWGRISRNWHVKKFLPCQEKMIWAWLVCLNKSEIYVFEVQPTSHENRPDDDRVTFDFICNIKICINMDYVWFLVIYNHLWLHLYVAALKMSMSCILVIQFWFIDNDIQAMAWISIHLWVMRPENKTN